MKLWKLYVLALGVFITGTSELIVSGIVNILAEDLGVTLAAAGQLVTVYSLSFAIGTPLIISLTARIDRKILLCGSLTLFLLGCLLAFVSSGIEALMISRVALGLASGVFQVVAFGAAAKMVPPEKVGSAVGTIVLGFSGAMILGVPLGIWITNWVNWQANFMILGLLSVLLILVIIKLIPKIEGDEPVPFHRQFKVLGSIVIFSGLFITLFRESGNSVLYTYLIPYMENILRVNPAFSGMIMLIFGLFGAVGAKLGGHGVDRFGAARVITGCLLVNCLSAALLPLFSFGRFAGLLLIALMLLSMFVTGPAIQSYFIQKAPQSSNLVLSLNTSTTQLGLAAGAGAGGVLLNGASTLAYHPWMTTVVLLAALTAAAVSFAFGRKGKRDTDDLYYDA
ncbi:MFS transporter [Paenibacillus sp. M1]|uniref:MFS transporter n=1 Tax=Paenibacillus haidiansis TaxID=1574488 RepID=A0ABU7VXK8_9BACL